MEGHAAIYVHAQRACGHGRSRGRTAPGETKVVVAGIGVKISRIHPKKKSEKNKNRGKGGLGLLIPCLKPHEVQEHNILYCTFSSFKISTQVDTCT